MGAHWTPADAVMIVGNYSQQQFDAILGAYPNVPIATAGIISYYPETIDHITFSNRETVKVALQHLRGMGHRQIGYLGIKEAEGTELFGSRKQTFIEIMRQAGTFHEDWVYESEHGKDRVEQGYNTMRSWLAKGDAMPTAIFCANDPIALGVVKALTESGYAIPRDISVMAHDGAYPTQYTIPELSTVDVHSYQLGVEGIYLLHERLSLGRKTAKRVYLYPSLISRDSVAPPPTGRRER